MFRIRTGTVIAVPVRASLSAKLTNGGGASAGDASPSDGGANPNDGDGRASDLLRLQLRGLFAARDCGMSVGITLRHAGVTERLRRQRCSLCGGRERGSSGRDTDCKF